MRSAVVREIDPATRLQQFRALQRSVAMSRDPAAAQTAEQLVGVIDLMMLEMARLRS